VEKQTKIASGKGGISRFRVKGKKGMKGLLKMKLDCHLPPPPKKKKKKKIF